MSMPPSFADQTSDDSLPRLRPKVLRQDVLEALRRAILNDDMKVGTRILEADVAQRMGVSRAPVREAIRHLEQEGLVQFNPHRGAVVLGLPEAEIDAVYELRAVIESRAMARVALTLTEEQDAQLAGLIAQMAEPLADGDIDRVAELDWQFHGLIIELSGFELLSRTWASLYGLVRLRSHQALGRAGEAADYFIRTSTESHRKLLDALRTGDPALAAAAGTEHVREVSEELAKERTKHPQE